MCPRRRRLFGQVQMVGLWVRTHTVEDAERVNVADNSNLRAENNLPQPQKRGCQWGQILVSQLQKYFTSESPHPPAPAPPALPHPVLSPHPVLTPPWVPACGAAKHPASFVDCMQTGRRLRVFGERAVFIGCGLPTDPLFLCLRHSGRVGAQKLRNQALPLRALAPTPGRATRGPTPRLCIPAPVAGVAFGALIVTEVGNAVLGKFVRAL